MLLKFPNYRIFSTGVLNLKMIRAYQHRCMAIGLPYVLNGLLDDSQYLKSAIQYCHWRSLLQSARFRQSRPSTGDSGAGVASLHDLRVAGETLQVMMCQLKETNDDCENSRFAGTFQCIINVHSSERAASIKFHKILHWPDMIRWFGSPSNYNAETWESAHRWYVKRWLGKLQHCNESSIKSLLRRSCIADAHGGSGILDPLKAQVLQRKPNHALRGISPDGTFKRVYFEKYNVWVSIGHYVIYSVVGSNAPPQVGRLYEIRRKRTSHVALQIASVRRCSSSSIMTQWTLVWEVVPGPTGMVLLCTDDLVYDIDIYPMQSDFTCEGRLLSCSTMHIM